MIGRCELSEVKKFCNVVSEDKSFFFKELLTDLVIFKIIITLYLTLDGVGVGTTNSLQLVHDLDHSQSLPKYIYIYIYMKNISTKYTIQLNISYQIK